jgi:hypothetical protein
MPITATFGLIMIQGQAGHRIVRRSNPWTFPFGRRMEF